MSFSDHAICWQIYPLGYTGAPVRPTASERTLTHRLRHVTATLDHPQMLGCNALILGPIFTSESHGYDTLDFFTIDERLGDEADFDELLDEAKKRGIGVILDGVFNHVGRHHHLVEKALAEGPDGQYAHMFPIDFSGESPTPSTFEGHGGLTLFNHDDPRVVDLVADVMNYWLDKGIAGWRLDAVYAIPPEFWTKVLPRVRAKHPDAFIYGEMIHGDYADYQKRSGIDSVTQYELWKAIWSSLKDGNFFELDWCLKRHNELLHTFVPFTFVGNHDTTRIASYTGPERAVIAATLLFTLGGMPCIYYGDEYAWEAQKLEELGGDDAVRPFFPADPDGTGEWMMDIHRKLIHLRRQNPWLMRAISTPVTVTNESYVYEVTGQGENEKLIVSLALEPVVKAHVTDISGKEIFTFTGMK